MVLSVRLSERAGNRMLKNPSLSDTAKIGHPHETDYNNCFKGWQKCYPHSTSEVLVEHILQRCIICYSL